MAWRFWSKARSALSFMSRRQELGARRFGHEHHDRFRQAPEQLAKTQLAIADLSLGQAPLGDVGGDRQNPGRAAQGIAKQIEVPEQKRAPSRSWRGSRLRGFPGASPWRKISATKRRNCSRKSLLGKSFSKKAPLACSSPRVVAALRLGAAVEKQKPFVKIQRRDENACAIKGLG